MRNSVTILFLIAALGVSACSSRLNPFNWFGGSEEVALTEEERAKQNPLIPQEGPGLLGKRPDPGYLGTPVASVDELRVERTPGGAIIRATGTGTVQGGYAIKLDPRNEGKPVKGVLSYDMKAVQNPRYPVGPASARRLIVGHKLTNQQLEGVRVIKVYSQSNARQARR
ncbi:hypothetical protein [Shimia sp. FJ5]|uniref:hypothetical protein n=1 Tax=Shimia sp. FJ5 TaxID=3079054 RepID=UPI00261BBEDE|nr:hypothetical protein [Shimia sp. FJ5]MDV4144461.1 hypothetical protein [Shimia sp. FJ5]